MSLQFHTDAELVSTFEISAIEILDYAVADASLAGLLRSGGHQSY